MERIFDPRKRIAEKEIAEYNGVHYSITGRAVKKFVEDPLWRKNKICQRQTSPPKVNKFAQQTGGQARLRRKIPEYGIAGLDPDFRFLLDLYL